MIRLKVESRLTGRARLLNPGLILKDIACAARSDRLVFWSAMGRTKPPEYLFL